MDAVVEGSMGSLISKLGSLLTGEYKLLQEAKGDIVFLKAELESMYVLLKKMSAMDEQPDEQTRCWVDEVRELSYDIEDNADDFVLHFEHVSNSNPQNGFRGFIDRCINLLSHLSSKFLFSHHETIKEFRGLKRRVVEASERRTRYKLDDTISKPNNIDIDLRLLALYAETTGLVGIDEPKQELIQLMGQGVSASQQLKVLAVVGFGGLGKTTLANQIYLKLEGEFQHRAFVSVSQKPNVRKIFRNILSQVGYVTQTETDMEIWDADELIRTLQEFLKHKRYFIVIDDIWDEITWNIIRCALPTNTTGSRVITTTRIDTVATVCCSNQCEYVYKMKSLSNHESKRLFFKRVFGSEDACPPLLEEVSGRILKKCGGLPLAIITISSLLASQRNKLKDEWEHVLNSLGSNLEVHPTLEGMREILSLSYKNLPHYLKPCMLYMGIYPEDYTIEKNDLVRQWVAQGFVRKEHGRDLEDVAEGYFNEFVNRSIIQPADTNSNDKVLSCRIHDMMLDLIIHKGREENFVTVIDELQAMVGLHDKVRRLSLDLDGVIDGTVLATTQLSQVRALARFGTSTFTPSMLKFRHLRVLTLECPSANHKQLIFDLTEICHLFQLRYLQVVSYGRIVLPGKIRALQQLETLELQSWTESIKIPSDVVHLRRLSHLIVPMGTVLPDGIRNMTSLRTLRHFHLGMNSIDNIRDLGGLTSLRNLRIDYTNCNRAEQVNHMRMDALSYSIEKLCSTRSDYRCLLQELCMWCKLPRVPKSIGELHSLHHLELEVMEVLEDDVGFLARLRSLVHLNLYIFGTPKEIIRFGTGFPVLKYFSITCMKISLLAFEAGAMSKLQWLEIKFNAHGWEQHGAPPASIQHLPALKEVAVRIGCYHAKVSDRRAAESDLTSAIEAHAGRPTANMSCENMWFGFEDFRSEEVKTTEELNRSL